MKEPPNAGSGAADALLRGAEPPRPQERADGFADMHGLRWTRETGQSGTPVNTLCVC